MLSSVLCLASSHLLFGPGREKGSMEESREGKRIEPTRETSTHTSYYCDGCAVNPIVGVRHHCLICEDFDLCEACVERDDLPPGINTHEHDSTHPMVQFITHENVTIARLEEPRHTVLLRLDAGGAVEDAERQGMHIHMAQILPELARVAREQRHTEAAFASFLQMLMSRGVQENQQQQQRPTLSKEELEELVEQLREYELAELPVSEVCPICLLSFRTGNGAEGEGTNTQDAPLLALSELDVVRLTTCKHTFHRECVTQWITTENASCPLCRHNIKPPSANDTPPESKGGNNHNGSGGENGNGEEEDDITRWEGEGGAVAPDTPPFRSQTTTEPNAESCEKEERTAAFKVYKAVAADGESVYSLFIPNAV
jgi:hypothetical protein